MMQYERMAAAITTMRRPWDSSVRQYVPAALKGLPLKKFIPSLGAKLSTILSLLDEEWMHLRKARLRYGPEERIRLWR